jgi:two-component system response regulator FixJ
MATEPPARPPFPIYIVDDDAEIRTALAVLLEIHALPCRAFESGDAFLDVLSDLDPGLVLLDIRMPGSDGLAVLSELHERRYHWPVIVMTGHGEVATAVSAMKLGALEFLEKPFREPELMDALARGAAALRERAADEANRGEAIRRVRALTPRELQLLQALLNGLSNKQIADDLAISIRTVEMHRASLMRKLDARSLADAVILASEAGMRRTVGDGRG